MSGFFFQFSLNSFWRTSLLLQQPQTETIKEHACLLNTPKKKQHLEVEGTLTLQQHVDVVDVQGDGPPLHQIISGVEVRRHHLSSAAPRQHGTAVKQREGESNISVSASMTRYLQGWRAEVYNVWLNFIITLFYHTVLSKDCSSFDYDVAVGHRAALISADWKQMEQKADIIPHRDVTITSHHHRLSYMIDKHLTKQAACLPQAGLQHALINSQLCKSLINIIKV